MSWFRLEFDLPDHHKTRALARRLGRSRHEALGLLVTLWCQVGRLAPDGCLHDYEPEDVEDFAGWTGEPMGLVGALVEVGLLDLAEGEGLSVHGWLERAESYRKARDKAAKRQRAKAQTAPSGPNSCTAEHVRDMSETCPQNVARDGTGRDEDESKNVLTDASIAPPDDVRDLWNIAVRDTPIPTIRVLTKARRAKLKTRAAPDRDLAWWRDYFRRIASSAFCRGETGRGWVASFDWAVKGENTIAKVLKGTYDQRAPPRTNGRQPTLGDMAIDGYDQARAEVEREQQG